MDSNKQTPVENPTVEDMLKEHYRSPRPFKYALVTLGGSLATRIVLSFLTTGSGAQSMNLVWEILVTLVSYIAPLYFLRLYFQNADLSAQYKEGVHWAKSFFWLAFPGELARFLISIPAVSGRFFCYTGWQLLTLLYVYPQVQHAGSQAELSGLLLSTAIFLPVFNLLAFALHLVPLLWWYRQAWMEGQKEWEHLKKTYAEHEVEAAKRDEMPDAEAKIIPSHKAKDFDTYNQFHGKRKPK